jgi:C-terminal processing protease CtpA/Prc
MKKAFALLLAAVFAAASFAQSPAAEAEEEAAPPALAAEEAPAVSEDASAVAVAETAAETVAEEPPPQPDPLAAALSDVRALAETAGKTFSDDEWVSALQLGILSTLPAFRLVEAEEPVPSAATDEAAAEEPEPPVSFECLPGDILYVRVRGDGEGALAAFSQALDAIAPNGIYGVVVDFRGTTDLPKPVEEFSAFTNNLSPLVFLADENTGGEAEMLLARGTPERTSAIVGRETRGDLPERARLVLADGRTAEWAARPLVLRGKTYDGTHGVVPDVAVPREADDKPAYEPEEPRLRKGKTLSEEEIEDRALRDRTRHDAVLRAATDLLLGLKALGFPNG